MRSGSGARKGLGRWKRLKCHAQDLALLENQSCVILSKPLGSQLREGVLTVLFTVGKARLNVEGRVLWCILGWAGFGTQASESSQAVI